FFDDAIDVAKSRLLAIGAPDRAEGTVLGTAADGLHRRPHVAALRHEIPAAREKGIAIDAPAVVLRAWFSQRAIAKRARPRALAVAGHHRMGPSELARL